MIETSQKAGIYAPFFPVPTTAVPGNNKYYDRKS